MSLGAGAQLGEVLEKSLKIPWIFFNFEFSGLESVFDAFGCLRQNINHSSENLKVIHIKCCMFYTIINYQFKTRELTNVE